MYLRFEVLRTLRNRRFLVFSLAFPLVLFFAVAGPNRKARIEGVPFPLYYMTGMAAWGTMVAVVSSGARIAAERSVGWTRQMRITPLTTRAYFSAKVLCGYLMALFTIVAMCAAGTALGVRLSAEEWLTMIGLLLVGLIPFAVLGVLLGHLLRVGTFSKFIAEKVKLRKPAQFSVLVFVFEALLTKIDQEQNERQENCQVRVQRALVVVGREEVHRSHAPMESAV